MKVAQEVRSGKATGWEEAPRGAVGVGERGLSTGPVKRNRLQSLEGQEFKKLRLPKIPRNRPGLIGSRN